VEGGSRIRAFREAKGFSQQGFARRAGVDRAYLGRVEAGRQKAGIGFLQAVAPVLGLKELEEALAVVERFR
jgi:transcriptional regulator with XRE-family HTH domain